MNELRLPHNGGSTTHLGMGSSALMGATSLRDSLALLEAAFDAGIRHFDTAPSYGLGQAERCLGAFLDRHRGEVTVTSKYGIPAPKNSTLIGMARGIVKPVITLLPGLKQKLNRVAQGATSTPTARHYNVAEAQATLENSLRVMKVDRIDIWLLHEPTADNLNDERLLRFLQDSVKGGKIGSFGVGSGHAKMPAIYAERRAYCPVVQCEWNPLAPGDRFPGSFTVYHNVLKRWQALLTERLGQNAELRKKWSLETGADLASPGCVARLLIKAALLDNGGGIILFFSKKPSNIASNALIDSDVSLESSARALLSLLRREAGTQVENAR